MSESLQASALLNDMVVAQYRERDRRETARSRARNLGVHVGPVLAWDVAEGDSLTAPNVAQGVCARAAEPLPVGTQVVVGPDGLAWRGAGG